MSSRATAPKFADLDRFFLPLRCAPQPAHTTLYNIAQRCISLSLPTDPGTWDAQPTAFEMRQKNEKFAQKVREGKTAVKPSMRDKLANKSPVPLWALGLCVFVVLGGCEYLS